MSLRYAQAACSFASFRRLQPPRRGVAAGDGSEGVAIPEGPRGPSGLQDRMVVLHRQSEGRAGKRFRLRAHFFPAGDTARAPRTSQPLVVARPLPGPFSRNGRRRKSASFSTRPSRGRVRGLQAARENGLDVRLLGWSARMQGGTDPSSGKGEGRLSQPELDPQKPPVLHGEKGLSRKGPLPGQASYYATCTRLRDPGLLGTAASGPPVRVNGTSWFDHEFGSNQLSAEQTGWDWFGLHLSDGKDLMLYFIRRNDGSERACVFRHDSR